MIMDNERREFLRNLGRKTAGVAAAVTTPVMAQAADLSAEIKKLSGEFNHKLSEATSSIETRISGVSQRIEATETGLAYQRIQLHIIFLLLAISFAIDGGLSLSWLMM